MSGPFLCGPRPPGPQDLAIVAEFRRQLEDSWASANNPDGLCRCGHPWGIHDIDEYRGDGSEMCCVTGCTQTGCPGRRPRAQWESSREEEPQLQPDGTYEPVLARPWPAAMCAGCTVKPMGHEGECYQ